MLQIRRLLLSVVLLFASVPRANAEFNYEVEKRVVERINDFMNGPIVANGIVSKFRSNGGFEHGMDGRDRDAYLKFVYSLIQEFRFDMIYVGLEDGLFMGHGVGWGTYREPGNGYAVDDPSMQMYFDACVDRNSGKDANCTMEAGSKYIECVRDCGLMKCADDETQKCSKVLADSATSIETAQDPENIMCFQDPQTTKWCRQYAIKEVVADQPEQIGFVPRTYHCNDAQGGFTQTPGLAVKDGFLNIVGSPSLVMGDCEFENGVTKVERWEEGPYVYCGGNGQVCENTFDGGYRSRDYDPRYRSWYIQTKAMQIPNWSPPYPFFSNLDLGITHSHPIYTQDEATGRNIFEGVLAIDYTFADIGAFLEEGYGDSETLVIVFEQEEPNYMVASSTGRKAASKVLIEDETQPCPDDSAASNCKVVRETMSNLYDSSGDPLDSLMVRAYEQQRDNGYPRELLTVRNTEDDNDDELYIVQSSFYRPGGDLEWIILIISPATEGDADAVLPDNPLFGMVCVVAGMGFGLCFMFFVLFYRKRNERAIILADWRFTSAFLLGCALLNISSFTLLGENTDALCMTRMWSFHFLFALALSPLFVKVWRMWRMVGAPNRRPTVVNHTTAALLSLPIVAIATLLLFIFSLVDPPHQEEVISIEDGIVTQHVLCTQESSAFTVIMIIYEAGLVLAGCILAYVTRNLDSQFGEAKQLMFSMYNIAFIGIITTIIIYTMDIDATGEVILKAIAVFWATVFSSAAFVLPRLMTVHQEKKQTSIMKKKSASRAGSKNSIGERNSKVHFSEKEKSSEASLEDAPVTNGQSGQSNASGISDATPPKNDTSEREMESAKKEEPAKKKKKRKFGGKKKKDKTDDGPDGDKKRGSLKLPLNTNSARSDGDSFVKSTGWTTAEKVNPDSEVGQWSDGENDSDDDNDDEEFEDEECDLEYGKEAPETPVHQASGESTSAETEKRPSMATIKELEGGDASESHRDNHVFEDSQPELSAFFGVNSDKGQDTKKINEIVAEGDMLETHRESDKLEDGDESESDGDRNRLHDSLPDLIKAHRDSGHGPMGNQSLGNHTLGRHSYHSDRMGNQSERFREIVEGDNLEPESDDSEDSQAELVEFFGAK